MGILRNGGVEDWQEAATEEERALTAGPDDAGPIRTRAASPVQHTATWIEAGPESAARRFRNDGDVLGDERFDTNDDYTIAALGMPFDKTYRLLRSNGAVQDALDLTDSGHLFDCSRRGRT